MRIVLCEALSMRRWWREAVVVGGVWLFVYGWRTNALYTATDEPALLMATGAALLASGILAILQRRRSPKP